MEMRGLMIGFLAVISSMTMAQNKKDHTHAKVQASKPLSYSGLNKIPDGIIISCISYTALTDIPDGKLKTRPFKSLLSNNTAGVLPSIPKKDSLKK
jgi:methionine-rich copper-binding protein CopC